MKLVLSFFKKILNLFSVLCPEIIDCNSLLEQIEVATKDLEAYQIIKQHDFAPVSVYLPNAWYLTPYNVLYNTSGFGEEGHKQSNLKYPFSDIVESINGCVPLDKSSYYLKKYRQVFKQGYITSSDFKCYLNYDMYFYSLPYNDEKIVRSYDRKINKLILGVLSAHVGLYQFFENLQKYTDNPKRELDKILEITNGNMEDILVRCAGFDKAGVGNQKIISTSKVDCCYQFQEYLERGFKIDLVPPIIINREKGIVEELDLSSLIVDRMIERDQKVYQKIKK